MEPERLMAELAEGDDERAEAAAQALATGGEAALPQLRALLAQADRNVRWWALRALALIPAPEATDLIRETLQDSDPDLKAAAIVALGERQAAAADIILPYLSDQSPYLARLASDALVRLGRAAVRDLSNALKDDDPQVRANAARALALIADPGAIPALFEALEDDSIMVRHWADEGLERMGVGMVYFKP